MLSDAVDIADDVVIAEKLATAFKACDLDCSDWDNNILHQLAVVALDALNSDIVLARRRFRYIQDARKEIQELRLALKQTLRQWQTYAEMVESLGDCNLKTKQTSEGKMYRRILALASGT